MTLSNYYETENNEYCCETCPDEEVAIVKEEIPDDKLVWSRSLSDEEKSANLIIDDYSSKFETALEYLSERSNTKALSDFAHSQLEEWESESGNEDPPELPSTKPPDIKTVTVDKTECSDSGFPLKEQSVNSVSDNQLETASAKLEDSQEVVTKEESRTESAETTDSVIVVEDSIITISDSLNSKVSTEQTNPFEYPDDLNPFGDDDEEQDENSDQPISSAAGKTKSDYDSSLNPFGSEEDEEEQPAPSPRPRLKKKLKPPPEDTEIPESPFKDDEDDEKEGTQPTPFAKKKIVPAPRITLTPFWNESNEEQQSLNEKPVPLPRLLRCVVNFILVSL